MQKKYNNNNYRKKKYKKGRNSIFKNEIDIMDSILNINSKTNDMNNKSISNESTIDSPKKNDEIKFKLTEENLNTNSFTPKSFKIKKELQLKKLEFEKDLEIKKNMEKELLNIKIKTEEGEIKNLILKSNDNIKESIKHFLINNNINNEILNGLICLINKTLFALYLAEKREFSNENLQYINKLNEKYNKND